MINGWKRTEIGGSKARVIKKFQWTPYSVTCSCKKVQDGKLIIIDILTGYSVPLTASTLISPSTRSGTTLRVMARTLGITALRSISGFLIIGIADTTPCENTKDPTPRSICKAECQSIFASLSERFLPQKLPTTRTCLGPEETQGNPQQGYRVPSLASCEPGKSSTLEEAGRC
jgi:hypothetical protein